MTAVKYPVFIGDLKEAITLFDREHISVELSTEAGDLWAKDLTKIPRRPGLLRNPLVDVCKDVRCAVLQQLLRGLQDSALLLDFVLNLAKFRCFLLREFLDAEFCNPEEAEGDHGREGNTADDLR